MFKDDWRPSFSAGLLAGEAVALLLLGLLPANRALAHRIQVDALAFMPAGPRLALFAVLWGRPSGGSCPLGRERAWPIRRQRPMDVPPPAIHIQTLLPTARGLLRLAAQALPADVQGAPGLADPTKGLMTFTVPTIITLMAWGTWRTWLYFFEDLISRKAANPLFPPEEVDEPSPLRPSISFIAFTGQGSS